MNYFKIPVFNDKLNQMNNNFDFYLIDSEDIYNDEIFYINLYKNNNMLLNV